MSNKGLFLWAQIVFYQFANNEDLTFFFPDSQVLNRHKLSSKISLGDKKAERKTQIPNSWLRFLSPEQNFLTHIPLSTSFS